MKTNAPLSGLARLTIVGLVATGVGFLGAGVNPGPGPRGAGSSHRGPALSAIVAGGTGHPGDS